MKIIRFGFLGASKIGDALVDAIKHVDGAEIYAVAARDVKKAEAYKEKYGFKVAYGSYEEMLQDKNVDAVYISTIMSLHYEHALLALKYNKPVLLEKSLTTSLKDTINLYKQFEEKGVLILEALWTSFQPFNDTLKDLIKEIGEIKTVHAFFNYDIHTVPRLIERKLGGGAIMDLGIYPLSFVYRLLGPNYQKMNIAKVKRVNRVDVKDVIKFEYENDIKAKVTTNLHPLKHKNQALIRGTKGNIFVSHTCYPTYIKVTNKLGITKKIIDVRQPHGGYVFEVEAFIDALNKGLIECERHSHKDSIELAKIEDLIVNPK